MCLQDPGADGEELDKRRQKPFFPIPRGLKGPPRPGYLPYRLWIIMQMMARATWLSKYSCALTAELQHVATIITQIIILINRLGLRLSHHRPGHMWTWIALLGNAPFQKRSRPKCMELVLWILSWMAEMNLTWILYCSNQFLEPHLCSMIYIVPLMMNHSSWSIRFGKPRECLFKFLLHCGPIKIAGNTQDILEPLGFLRHLYACMNLTVGGLCFLGVVCSSWVTINRN